MLKILKYIFLASAIFYWAISHFQSLYNWAGKNKIYPDDYRYGDLYRLSFLPSFKEKDEKCADFISKSDKNKNTHLFILGDSFTDDSNINSNNFASENYTYIHWDKPQKVNLDTTKTNILILETVERSLKMHFAKVSKDIFSENKQNAVVDSGNGFLLKAKNFVEVFSHNTQKTEERLWQTLFNYDFVLFFKEIKAELDLKLFDRKSPNYNLSADKKEIFYFEEASVSCPNSAFYEVSDAEIEKMVENMNADYLQYKKLGFNEIYLSIIPNKVSILAPNLGAYNHVLERVQNHPNLKIKFIDTFSIFKKSPENVFSKSDTHWNCKGASMWQKSVNELVINAKYLQSAKTNY